MTPTAPAIPVANAALESLRALWARGGWYASLATYSLFALAVFLALGREPLLGSDHLTYFQLADSIIASCPAGDFWRETSSVRNFAIALAYLNPMTGSHVLSMKLVLFVNTVLFLLAAELFFGLFSRERLHAVLFALVSAFAVSFGVTSWGVTDSTALLPRTLVAPVVMFSMWYWMRFDGRPARYLAFSFLVLASLLHLSAFFLIGILALVEAWDFAVMRRFRIDGRVPAFVGGLALAVGLLYGLELLGLSSKAITIQVPYMLRSVGIAVPNLEAGAIKPCAAPSAPAAPRAAAAIRLRTASVGNGMVRTALPVASPPASGVEGVQGVPHRDSIAATAQEAWAIELRLRPWRNMPMPLVNVANAFASYALVLALCLAGMVAARREGFTRADGLMLGMFLAVPAFALLPQTLLWWLRSFTNVYPVTIEEVRALSLVMIPSLYFVARLFGIVLASGRPRSGLAASAIVAAALFLPLFMKGLPAFAREGILSVMTMARVVDPANEAAMANARSALGLTAPLPLYYATQGVRDWLAANARPRARVLTDRDDLVLLRDLIVMGPRQVGAVAFYATPGQAQLFVETSKAYGAKDTGRVLQLARELEADFVVVGWPVEGAAYSDRHFSVIAMRATGRP